MKRFLQLNRSAQRAFSSTASGVPTQSEIEAAKLKPLWEKDDQTAILITMEDKGVPGLLNRALNVFQDHNINLTSVQSKPPKFQRDVKEISFHIDFLGSVDEKNVQDALGKLEKMAIKDGLVVLGSKAVPWFPTKLEDLNYIGNKVLVLGDGIIDVDHPTFRDPVYRKRRIEIGQMAMSYRMHQPIPNVDYSKDENDTWVYCSSKLMELYKERACEQYNQSLSEFEREVGIDKIPQLEAISQHLMKKTGWRLKPVGGLLTQRDFLNGLAFRVFHSTQFIRHHTMPDYTPEPDIMHELMGHAPMLSVPAFAEFSHMVGLASLGASEIELKRLAQIYWFTIEFGLCREKTGNKVYGAGILGSVEELKYALSEKPKLYPLDLFEIAQNHMDNEITQVQPYYFVAESFEKMQEQFAEYLENMPKPFNVSFNERDLSIIVDRKIKTRQERI